MRAHSCLGSFVRTYQKAMPSYTDDDIMDALRNRNSWYQRNVPDHRLWLRMLYQEARKRGLGT